MRRLVGHGLVGVAAGAFAVAAAVTTFGGPAVTTTAEPAPSSTATGFVPVAYFQIDYQPLDPEADVERAATAARDEAEAEHARIAAGAAESAYQRELSLGSQGQEIDKHSDEIKAAKKKAEEAEAKAAKAEAEAKKAAIANQGYTPGTTDLHEMARQILLNKFSYGDDQFACFSWIISRESNWNPHAKNASSGAYGLPQSLPGSKMGSVASDWEDNPATQIIWGAGYMKNRYGSPCGAKSHWESHGNY